MITRLELLAVLLAVVGVTVAWYHHHLIEVGIQERVEVDRRAAERQTKVDQAKIDKGASDHAKELADRDALYGGGAIHIVRYTMPTNSLPAPTLPLSEPPTPRLVSCDGPVYRERAKAYELLEWAGDTLAADCRELNAVTH